MEDHQRQGYGSRGTENTGIGVKSLRLRNEDVVEQIYKNSLTLRDLCRSRLVNTMRGGEERFGSCFWAYNDGDQVTGAINAYLGGGG